MSSPRFFVRLLIAAVGISLIPADPAMAQAQGATERVEPAGDLQKAFETALASAKGSESLDAAYDLLGVAGTAQERGLKPLAEQSATTFVELVQRASAAALRKGGSTAHDTLDQLVDLRFFARSQEVVPAMTGLDAALRSLFPAVAKDIEQHIDKATEFDDQVAALSELTSLQASAAQVLMNDIAARAGAAIDARLVKLETAANQAAEDSERGRRLNSVAEAKRAREEQVADATANNVDTGAVQLKASGRTEESTRAGTGNPSDVTAD